MNDPQDPTTGSITFNKPIVNDPRTIINKGIANQSLEVAQQKALDAIMSKSS